MTNKKIILKVLKGTRILKHEMYGVLFVLKCSDDCVSDIVSTILLLDLYQT